MKSFNSIFLILMFISIVPTARAMNVLKASSLGSAVKKSCLVAGCIGIAYVSYLLLPEFRKYRDLWHLQNIVDAETKKLGIRNKPQIVDSDIYACLGNHLLIPTTDHSVFRQGPTNPRYYYCMYSLIHELGHLLYRQNHGPCQRTYEEELFADSCVPDDQCVLTASRDFYLDLHRKRFDALCDGQFQEDEDYMKKYDDLYKQKLPDDVHPCDYRRAKYFNDRLKNLKAR